ncbi:GNAT family N-acetyltransferase [Vibrio cincinnatiensis]|uniref:GNAT family N-acetyltransferase n=1 Tax=Vibrio cincinnatiensis TaxID=675 RepID=UPI001EDD8AE7|nr:GNAT family N-acetyltransferase [Vibrio cincinnatiensis]MCG3732791.1 tRNA(Met) cytidine acetyltransferase [Vibrio cincinnatiensis]MCG3739016.1 tRNA(Met) cytidine acetyltransferase [Vibrio cincinnatiensis]MCG3741928.1 tRNA(Met) cytidine acetyltransferase [Vibrio cincinnatiensis]
MADLTIHFGEYIKQLKSSACTSHHRFGLYFQAETEWSRVMLKQGISLLDNPMIVQLGGPTLFPDLGQTVAYNQGQRLLGQECDVLICDCSDGWDANSFSAALGTLIGGGLLFILGHDEFEQTADKRWLTRAFHQLLVINEQEWPSIPEVGLVNKPNEFAQQNLAVEQVVRTVEGHRKRPLILTADRGRGKSSALGMAAARLMQSRSLSIIVTAPTLAAIAPVFDFAQRALPFVRTSKGFLGYQRSELRYLPPDEIQRYRPSCDLLLVDEAAALPLSFLQFFVEHYHRSVFSTTIHGYEGCGRGFTLKFQHWLKQVRPQMRSLHLDQPIRWAEGDPIEAWHRQTFLLNDELELEIEDKNDEEVLYHSVTKQVLLDQPEVLSAVFSLLVNAHYQTSPNDLFHLLADDNVQLFIARQQQRYVACLLAVREGQLDAELIKQVQWGNRRPKGHLAPITIANQLGISQAAYQSCWRVMRIAVHPVKQNQGLGSALLQHFIEQYPCDYLATSFGATAELIHFWQKNDFYPIKMGSHRDQASGCYSVLMAYSQRSEWLDKARRQLALYLRYALKDSLQELEPKVVRALLKEIKSAGHESNTYPEALIAHYALGGANYESVAVWIEQWLLEMMNIDQVSDVLIAKVLQQHSWQSCALRYGYTGRKQIEQYLRGELTELIANLQCKPKR